MIINQLLLALARMFLGLFYRVRVRGIDAVAAKGRTGILFLPNHPALIDPIILMSRLWGRFRVRPLAGKAPLDFLLIRRFAPRFRPIPIPDLDKPLDPGVSDEIRKVLAECVAALRDGGNIMLYPQGHLDYQRFEDLGGNSAVESILRELPEVRVVLVRVRGLWGSGFSFAAGTVPDAAKVIRKGALGCLASGIFFTPRRRVDIELVEPGDFPRAAGRNVINRWLERFYNDGATPNTYVPFSIWERGGTRTLPEPERPRMDGDLALVPPAVRETVRAHIVELTGVREIRETTRLANDLGMDSLARVELVTWLHAEFGTTATTTDALVTVGDVMLAASGQTVAVSPAPMGEIPRAWFTKLPRTHRPDGLVRMTIPEAFLHQAACTPDAVIVADPTSGARTYRDVVLAVHVLKRPIAGLPGERVGIMLPASVAADVTYLSTLFADRTPAMINWTLGTQNLRHCLASAGVERIVTSRTLVLRLQSQGVDLAAFSDRFVYLEDMRSRLGRGAKLVAWLRSRFWWGELRHAATTPLPGRSPSGAEGVAAVLFTSGSESVPKAVPLTHANILTNVSDCFDLLRARHDDSILGILPPFHSFGLTTCVVLPLVLGGRVVHYPNPTDGAALARMTKAYRPTMLMGTPTFLHGLVRAAYVAHPPSGECSSSAPPPSQSLGIKGAAALQSLRIVISGSEKCTERVYRAVAQACPRTVIMEGYGVTECSPVVSANRGDDARPGTIGKPLASVEVAVVDPASGARVELGHEGMLLVRGPSVFSGYLNYDGPSPFVEFEGKSWYRTGDLVREAPDGWLTFVGRLNRFAKLGGEMVSLPAIEAALDPRLVADEDELPSFAVVATPAEESPEIFLFTTKRIERDEANQVIRAAGLSGLHNIRRVLHVEALPLLGTGKIDYRALTEQLRNAHDALEKIRK